MRMQASAFEGTSADSVSSVWCHVAAFAASVDASLGRWLTDTYRLGLTEYRALVYLSQSADKELRVNDLAERVGLNQSSVTRLVSRLEGKKLTRRDICPNDGRGVYAVITEQGEALVAEVQDPYENRVRELLGNAAAHLPQLDGSQLSRALMDVARLVAS